MTNAAMMPNGIASVIDRRAREQHVDRPFDPALEALERDIVDVDNRQTIQVFEPRPQGDELQEIRHDLDVDALAAGDVHQIEQLGMLFEGEGDVQVVHALPLDDVGDLGQRPEERQASIADVVAAGPVVHESDHLISQLTVLQDAVGYHAAQIAGAGDQDAFKPDPGTPATLEELPHAFHATGT